MYQIRESNLGQAAGAGALAIPAPVGFKPRLTAQLDSLRNRVGDIDLVPDLGTGIGGREWWRGVITCVVLCSAAIGLSPGFRPVTGYVTAPVTADQWDESRALAITPLALGADSGRRMAANDMVVPLTDTPERPMIELTASISQGDGLARVLQRAGVSTAEAVRVTTMVAGAVPLASITPGTRMDLVLGRRPNRNVARPLDRMAFRAALDLKLELVRQNGVLELKRIPIAVDDTPLRIQGRVGASLYRSARAAGASPKIVEAYIKALAGKMSISTDVQADNRFDIIVAHRRAETGETETGRLLLAGLDRGGKPVRLMQWTVDGRTEWFEASGVGKRRGQLTAPVNGRQTSGFGMRRHPLLGYSRFHRGIDFGAAYGSPILAATDGVVAFAGWHGGHGKYVKLNHSGGLATAYAHMSRFAVSPGQRVRQGQVIGYVGSTGLSTGPHLHYELYRNGEAINPRSINFVTTSTLTGRDLQAFKAELARLLSVTPGAAAAKVPVKSTDTPPPPGGKITAAR